MKRFHLALFIGAIWFFSPAVQEASEYILISGGPALSYFEHSKPHPHDTYWGNFVDAVVTRIPEVRPQLAPTDVVTWMVFRPSYEKRSVEQNEDLIVEIQEKARKSEARLVWFFNRDGLIDYLNQPRKDGEKICGLEYFGHSNKRTFMFDYSNTLDGSSTEPGTFHLSKLKQINSSNFTSEAYCKSWGCHSGEEYSGAWKQAIGISMIGAVGKTDFSHGGLPFLSTDGGRWTK